MLAWGLSVRKNVGTGLKVSSVSSVALIMIFLNIFLFNEHLTRMGASRDQHRLWGRENKFEKCFNRIRTNVKHSEMSM